MNSLFGRKEKEPKNIADYRRACLGELSRIKSECSTYASKESKAFVILERDTNKLVDVVTKGGNVPKEDVHISTYTVLATIIEKRLKSDRGTLGKELYAEFMQIYKVICKSLILANMAEETLCEAEYVVMNMCRRKIYDISRDEDLMWDE